jgi:glucose/arabinose dehydrogenase
VRRWPRWLVVLLVAVLLGCAGYTWYFPHGLTINFPGFRGDPLPESELSKRVRLPAGFSITTYAGGIRNARMLRFTLAGDLLVSSPRTGKVILLERDADGDGSAQGQRVLLEGLDSPHGLELHQGFLYVAEGSAILRARFDAQERRVTGAIERVIQGFPQGGNHWTRTIGIGPDGWLYLSIGSSCNVCIEKDPRRAAIVRYRLDGSSEQLYATGLRNAVGFAWQPGTGALYATDNGRDLLGDDFPPCEFNRVVEGGFYGWPFANGDRVPDPDYGSGRDQLIVKSIPPAHGFTAHTAPLGVTFYTGTAFPRRYRGAAFVALHGSWNRSRKSGYEVVALFLAPDGTVTEEAFATGFERNEDVFGRPVDVAEGPDGALYVSDDFTGSVYRISYGSAASRATRADQTTAAAVVVDPLAGLSREDREGAIARGRALWDANDCASCHTPGEGRETYRPLAKLASKFGVDALVEFLKVPQPPMPAYPLSPAERRDLAILLLHDYP